MALPSLGTALPGQNIEVDQMEPFSSTVSANKWLEHNLDLANKHTANKRYQKAFKTLSDITKTSPNYIPAYLDLGNLHYSQNRYANALRIYGHGKDLLAGPVYSHELPKENRNVYYELMKGGRECEKKLGILNAATQPEIVNLPRAPPKVKNCDYTSIRRLLTEAKVEADKKNYRRGLEILTSAILLDPDLVEGYMKRGKLYYKLNKYTDAFIDFDIGKRKLADQVSFLNPRVYPRERKLYNKCIKWENKCQSKLSPLHPRQRGKAFAKLFA